MIEVGRILVIIASPPALLCTSIPRLQTRLASAPSHSASSRGNRGYSVVGGDFTGAVVGDTSCPDMGSHTSRVPEARLWDRMFPDTLELHQPGDTWVRLTGGQADGRSPRPEMHNRFVRGAP